MAWKTMDVDEQRVRFVVEAVQKTRTFCALCTAYEISRPTGYLWLQRYRKFGVAGIAEQSRKPHRSPGRTKLALEQQVIEVRQRYPDWGARKLRVLLAREGMICPAIPSIAFCCATIWCVRRNGARQPCSASSVVSRTNCGRWTLRDPRDGRRRWGRSPCWTTIAAI
ncbi:MAG TPA: helix-turn-helix domain-containing protein [Candidatus Acidoferrum sp.]|nr:helix-turn-helix domain-containing protein [Candidatus Acidoferrum sp.]